jgi:hypothetical protein
VVTLSVQHPGQGARAAVSAGAVGVVPRRAVQYPPQRDVTPKPDASAPP